MDPIISTDWLAAHLDDPTVVVLDATWFMPGEGRDAHAEFAARHIPGARFFGIDEISDHSNPLPHMLAAPADFAVAARRLGVSDACMVVAYDRQGMISAARAWWNFRAMGHANTAVLDGGLQRWIAEGRPVETGWPNPPHGDFKARPEPDLVRDLEAVCRAMAEQSAQVVDARAADRFSGETPEPRAGLRSGHMPGARNLPWMSLVGKDGALAPKDQIASAFGAAGVALDGPLITTCGSGISASFLALALARLGRDDAAVYDGSWSEWGARDDTPVAVGAAVEMRHRSLPGHD